MKKARVFELKKGYPGSPDVGEKVIETFTGARSKFILAKSVDKGNLKTFSESEITNFPEFWSVAT